MMTLKITSTVLIIIILISLFAPYIAPGMCIMMLSLSINLIGDGIRDHLDISEYTYKQVL